MSAESASSQRILLRSLVCLQCIRLCSCPRCCGFLPFSPVIENLVHMPDLPVFRMFQKTQRKIIILRSIKLRPQKPGFPDNTRPVYSQMVRIHHGEKCVRRPVRFKERIMSPGSILRQLVFITVYKVQLRILIQFSGHLIQCIRCQNIVTVQEGDKVTLCPGNTIVRCPSNPAVLFPVDNVDPLALLVVFQDFSHGRHT